MICMTVISKIGQEMPASASNEPGCGVSSQRNNEVSYGQDISREGELELKAVSKVPYLNDSVDCPSDKQLVSKFNSNRPHSTKMSRNYTQGFPLRAVC